MSAFPFLIHVGELRRAPGEPRHHRVEADVDWAAGSSRVSPGPVRADVDLIATSGGVVVTGRVHAGIVHQCVRCLRDYGDDVTVSFSHLVEDASTSGDDGYELTGEFVDLEPILRDEVMLSLPLVTRCGDDCPGLGQAQQNDLNAPAAGRSESPFAALQDLFEPGSGD